jgi:F-type H+-transporting ATPase subunit alpha
VDAVREYEQELLRFIDEKHPQVWSTFAAEKQLNEKLRGQLDAALKEFATKFVASGSKAAGKPAAAAAAAGA